jgi:hypothetical protein
MGRKLPELLGRNELLVGFLGSLEMLCRKLLEVQCIALQAAHNYSLIYSSHLLCCHNP